MKEKESAGNVETKLMLEQGSGFLNVVWKRKKKKKTKTAKEEALISQHWQKRAKLRRCRFINSCCFFLFRQRSVS